MSKKIDKNKLVTMLISGVLVASAGTYAFASQYNQPEYITTDTVSSVVSSETVSIAESSTVEPVVSTASVESVQSTAESIVEFSAPKEETKTESTATNAVSQAPAETQAPVSQPEQSASSVSEANTSSYVASLELGVCYYDVIDPETGKHVDIYNSRYNDLKKQLGGDAGKVDTDQSTACQAALAQYKAKQASSTASTK